MAAQVTVLPVADSTVCKLKHPGDLVGSFAADGGGGGGGGGRLSDSVDEGTNGKRPSAALDLDNSGAEVLDTVRPTVDRFILGDFMNGSGICLIYFQKSMKTCT